MSCFSKLALAGLFFSMAAWAQPTIGGVVNSASYTKAPLDANGTAIGNNLIAQGAIFVVFGSGMGPATLVSAPSLPLTTSLPDANGTSVNISSGGQTTKAFLVYTSAVQVAAILPSTTPTGAATVTVTFNGRTSSTFPITVAKSALGVFTKNSQGSGPAVAQVFRSATDISIDALTNPAQSGNTLVIYATGLGAIPGADNTPPGAVPVGTGVTVNIAGVSIPVAYAGRSPNFPGLDQINFTLPANLPSSCYVPAEVTANGLPSNLFYLSLGSGPTCADPLGLPAAALARLDSGGTADIGLFHLLHANNSGLPVTGSGGLFDRVNADGAFQLFRLILNAFGGVTFPVAGGSCAVLDTLDTSSSALIPDFSSIGGKELNPGASVHFSGSNSVSQDVAAFPTGGYLGIFSVSAGTWTLTGSGGPDIGAFTAKTDLPPDLTWTNAGNLTLVPRSAVTIAWTGGNLNSSSLVTIFGTSVVINPTDPTKSRGKEFFCNAPASAGSFVIPASVLSQLPSSVSLAAGEVAVGNLGITAAGGSAFTAPLTAGGSIDAGLLSYGEPYTMSVKYQ